MENKEAIMVTKQSPSLYFQTQQIIEQATKKVGSWNDEFDIWDNGEFSIQKYIDQMTLWKEKLAVANETFTQLGHVLSNLGGHVYKDHVKCIEERYKDNPITDRALHNGCLLDSACGDARGHAFSLKSADWGGDPDTRAAISEDLYAAAKAVHNFLLGTDHLLNYIGEARKALNDEYEKIIAREKEGEAVAQEKLKAKNNEIVILNKAQCPSSEKIDHFACKAFLKVAFAVGVISILAATSIFSWNK